MKAQVGFYVDSWSNWSPIKFLGNGSFGHVFLGVSIHGSLRLVALKVALFKYSSSLQIEERVLKNFIGCPEIVQLIDSEVYSSNESVVFNLVLEYADGGTLGNLITQRGKLSEYEVKVYMKMILKGLSCIHDRGFVHVDLKPANILVFLKNDGSVQLKIADFGLSSRCEGMVECSDIKMMFRGTPNYMSPESVIYGHVNTALDIWSLGCILVEMVGGKLWSECKNTDQLMKKLVVEMEIPEIPEDLSREGRDFLASCLDHNTQRRWTAKRLLEHPYLKY